MINIMGIRSKVILNKTNNNYLVMEPLTKEQEENIDNSADKEGCVRFILDEKYIIPSRDIFLYGEINLNNQDDLELIENSNILTEEVNNASILPSNIDYKTGVITSDENDVFKWYHTWNKLNWFKYNHLLLGKPERIIIYRVDKRYVPRNRSTIDRTNDSEFLSENI